MLTYLMILLKGIEEDRHQHPQSRHILIILGDYIDRGPDSRKVIETLIHISPHRYETHHLKGNHESLFLNFLKNTEEEGLLWLSNGGWATLIIYGFDIKELPSEIDDFPIIRDKILQRMPKSHLEFLKSLKLHYQLGDYFLLTLAFVPIYPWKNKRKKTYCGFAVNFYIPKKNSEKSSSMNTR